MVYDEPRVKISLLVKRSEVRALEDIKNDERRPLEKAGDAGWRSVSVTTCIADAIDAHIAAHREARQ